MPKVKYSAVNRSVSFPPEIYAEITSIAKEEDRSLQNVILRLLRSALKSREGK